MLEISKSIASECLYGASDVIPSTLNQSMMCLHGPSDIITWEKFSEVQTGPLCLNLPCLKMLFVVIDIFFEFLFFKF